MNILSVSGIKYPSYSCEKTSPEKRFGLTMSGPLAHDVVSFKATPKSMGSRANAINMQLAKDIHNDAEVALAYMRDKINQYIFDFLT